jgi:hypothetical protein
MSAGHWSWCAGWCPGVVRAEPGHRGNLVHCVAVLERTGLAILIRDSSIPDQQASHLLTSPQATADGGPGVYGIGPAGWCIRGYWVSSKHLGVSVCRC